MEIKFTTMREIKFRAWDDKNKKWLLGYDYPNLGGFSMFGETMAFGEYSKMLSSFSIEDWEYIKLMQFTGLKDNNGKEIYEGDKVMKGTIYCEVIFQEGCFVFKGTGVSMTMRDHQPDEFEVIGNIYEKPELLTA